MASIDLASIDLEIIDLEIIDLVAGEDNNIIVHLLRAMAALLHRIFRRGGEVACVSYIVRVRRTV